MNAKPEQKNLELIMREKFATGYDPIKLQVKMKSSNDENLEVSIEGIAYSVRNNHMVLIEKKGGHLKLTSVEPKTTEPSVTPETPEPVAPGASEPTDSSSPASDAATPSTEPADHAERLQNVIAGFGGTETQPVTTADNGETVLNVNDAEGNVLATGTLAELESSLENTKASTANTDAA